MNQDVLFQKISSRQFPLAFFKCLQKNTEHTKTTSMIHRSLIKTLQSKGA